MEINDPVTLAEVVGMVDRYEIALMDNDIAVLDALFLQSPETIRYGVGENLYGSDEIARFRTRRVGGSPRRTVLRRVITSYGKDFATANLEFRREGGTRIGRQSQTWIRTSEGWRIVAAHVSLMDVIS